MSKAANESNVGRCVFIVMRKELSDNSFIKGYSLYETKIKIVE